jgi:hypothetical protein
MAVETASLNLENKSLCIDVSIVDATCARFVARSGAGSGRLYAAGRVEAGKGFKNVRAADRRRVEFTPFVVETHGALGKAAQGVVKRLAEEKRRLGGTRQQLGSSGSHGHGCQRPEANHHDGAAEGPGRSSSTTQTRLQR